jgi:hypothetical protein
MKKTLITLAVALAATGMFAQGTISTLNSATTYMSTNGVLYGGGTGLTVNTVGLYYFALLENASAAVTGGDVSGVINNTNPLSSTWTYSGITLTNMAAVGYVTGGSSVLDSMWAYNTTNAFLVVGWSQSLGTSWVALSNNLQTAVANGGTWSTPGYYAVSDVGWGQPGGGSPSLPVYHIWGTTGAAQGTPAPGFTLYAVPVPEPGMIALAGLGGLSLLLIRRRK